MRYIIVMVVLAVMACSSMTEPEVLPAGDMILDGGEIDGKMVTVQYLVCGTCDFVSMAFCSQVGPLDTIPAAVLPVIAEFEVKSGTEAFMRVHKRGNGVVTVLVIANGIVVQDTALEGDETAEARARVWFVE